MFCKKRLQRKYIVRLHSDPIRVRHLEFCIHRLHFWSSHSLTASPPDPDPRSSPCRRTPRLSQLQRCCRCCCRPCASSLRRPPAAAGPRTTRTSFPDPSVCPVSHLDASVRSSQSHLSLSCLVCPSSRPLPSFLFNVRMSDHSGFCAVLSFWPPTAATATSFLPNENRRTTPTFSAVEPSLGHFGHF